MPSGREATRHPREGALTPHPPTDHTFCAQQVPPLSRFEIMDALNLTPYALRRAHSLQSDTTEQKETLVRRS